MKKKIIEISHELKFFFGNQLMDILVFSPRRLDGEGVGDILVFSPS